MKICKECKYAKRDLLLGWSFSECHHPENRTIDLITGKGCFKSYKYCSTQRIGEDEDTCGILGNWFEQKLHWWEKV